MAVNRILLIIGIWIGLWGTAPAFKSDESFCIRTEPALLEDQAQDTQTAFASCEIVATAMTPKEQKTFVTTMCHEYEKQDYYYLKIRNGILQGRASYQEFCNGSRNQYFAWIPYSTVKQKYSAQFNKTEPINYIAKAYDAKSERTELCSFQHNELAGNSTENDFSCVLMMFEDNFFSLHNNVRVLIELQPFLYELQNISYQPWVNTSSTYKTLLGETVLKNPHKSNRQVYGSINYAYVEAVKLNVSSLLSAEEALANIPILFEHRYAVVELNPHGVGDVNVKDRAYFGRVMQPSSTMRVYLTGQWAVLQQQFSADLHEHIGSGIRRFKQTILNGMISFERIEHTEPVYETPKSTTHVTSASLLASDDEVEKTHVTVESNEQPSDAEWIETADKMGGGHPYPNFYPYFVAGCLVVGAAVLLGLVIVVRNCGKKTHREGFQVINKL